MPNTMSTKKALRSSLRKRDHNLFWKKKVKESVKVLKDKINSKEKDVKILNENLQQLQKTLDKATKEKIIHKNKANRLKSIYAKKISANLPKEAARKKSKS